MRYDRHEDRRSSTTPYSREAKKPRLNTSGKEETCRTLFIRNVSFSATERDVVSLFEPFGQIKQTFSLIEKRGLIFITFFDLRSAEKARVALQDFDFNGRKLDVHYSLPRESEILKDRCGEDKNQGTLKLKFEDSRGELLHNELFEYLSKFGEIKGLNVTKFNKAIVEFWDSRAAVDAFESIYRHKRYKDGSLYAEYDWDRPDNVPSNSVPDVTKSNPVTTNTYGLDNPIMQNNMVMPSNNQVPQQQGVGLNNNAQILALLSLLNQRPPNIQPVSNVPMNVPSPANSNNNPLAGLLGSIMTQQPQMGQQSMQLMANQYASMQRPMIPNHSLQQSLQLQQMQQQQMQQQQMQLQQMGTTAFPSPLQTTSVAQLLAQLPMAQNSGATRQQNGQQGNLNTGRPAEVVSGNGQSSAPKAGVNSNEPEQQAWKSITTSILKRRSE